MYKQSFSKIKKGVPYFAFAAFIAMILACTSSKDSTRGTQEDYGDHAMEQTDTISHPSHFIG